MVWKDVDRLLYGSGPEKVIGFCEHGNEPVGTVNYREFLD